ncbi:MAG: hypothetical protein ACRDJX_05050 [Solirubrobacteraceae bacterium]
MSKTLLPTRPAVKVRARRLRQTVAVLTFILAFACACAVSSAYGSLAGTWRFGVVEALWTLIAVSRYRSQSREGSQWLA